MGSGPMQLDATFQPTDARAEFTSKLEIADADMVAMNDVLRARGGFDVVAGRFSLYSEIAVHNGRVEGYVKPIFSDLDVYDRRQDGTRTSSGRRTRASSAASAPCSRTGRATRWRRQRAVRQDRQPADQHLEIVLGLLQNAFVRAILPGLEQQRDAPKAWRRKFVASGGRPTRGAKSPTRPPRNGLVFARRA